jgi:hypothetical protein
MKKLIITAFVGAFANCFAGHVVDCMFERLNLGCPRNGLQ